MTVIIVEIYMLVKMVDNLMDMKVVNMTKPNNHLIIVKLLEIRVVMSEKISFIIHTIGEYLFPDLYEIYLRK